MFVWLYYAVSIGLLLALFYYCIPEVILKRGNSGNRQDVVFIGTALAMLFFMRLPTILYNAELNPDESQIIAHAITLTQDPVFGRSVDGTSIGPLTIYLLLIPHVFGLALDYTSARLMGAVLIAVSLLLFYGGLLQLFSPLVSRLTMIIVTLFFCWATHYDFIHYSSELSSLPIVTACFLITARQLQSAKASLAALLWLGFLTGLIPYGKLQPLPIVGMMLIVLSLYLVRRHRFRAITPLSILGLGLLLPSLVVFSFAYYFGVVSYFVDFYFIGNFVTYPQIYANVPLVSKPLIDKLIRLPNFFALHVDFLVCLVFTCLLSVAGVLLLQSRFVSGRKKLTHWPSSTWLIIFTIIGAVGAVAAPGTEFGHHLLFLVFPLGWVISLCLQQIEEVLSTQQVRVRFANVVIAVILANLFLVGGFLKSYGYKLGVWINHKPETESRAAFEMNPNRLSSYVQKYLLLFPTHAVLKPSVVSETVGKYTTHLDRIAVWGWNCSYYVETQLAQAVSESHAQRSIIPNVMQTRYLQRYADELNQNQPKVFIDAVGPKSLYLTRADQKHEYFREIAPIIRKRYVLADSVDDVRIYVRRDALASQRGVPAQPIQ